MNTMLKMNFTYLFTQIKFSKSVILSIFESDKAAINFFVSLQFKK